MNKLQDKLTSIFPALTFEQQAPLTIEVPANELHKVATSLKSDAAFQFDFLTCLTGVDWGETLGVVYHLYSTQLKYRLVMKCRVAKGEHPTLDSVSDLWAAANFNEREVFEFLGIRFLNHPDMRPLFLRYDWQGYPLRKDYDGDPNINPIPSENDESPDSTSCFTMDLNGEIVEQKRMLFEESEYVVNIGPQHPATHGVLRFRTAIEGETITKIDPYCGYIHRGIEKMAENMTYPQLLAMTDRLDYLSAHQNRHALCLCIEEALSLEVPERAKYIRTMMDELSRIASHLLFFSTFCMDLGALTAFFYGFRDREMILDIFEESGAGRLIQQYYVIGGVANDLHPNFPKRVKELLVYLPKMLKEYHQVFTGNIIAQQRMKKIGLLTREDAIRFAISGPTARASGLSCDIRKSNPYGVYDQVEFREVIYQGGDIFDRYMVRLDEINESLHLLEQLVEMIPQGEIAAKTKAIIRLPEGNFYRSVETGRGEFGVYIESRGEKSPYRLKFRSPNLPLVNIVETLAKGSKIADLIAIGGSLDYIVPDIDR